LTQKGFSEFIFTGTNVGSYGYDKNSSLAKILKKISKINGVKRVRVGSIEPIQIDEEFKEILKEKWMAKHLHIALQYCEDKMLKIMNRRNRVKNDIELLEEISDKGFAVGSDIIVGHPGESNEIFEKCVENFKKLPITHLHIFSYSKREGTASSKMKDIPKKDIVKEREKILKEIVKEKNFNFRKKHPDLEVLVEGKKGEYYSGFDQYYNKIFIQSERDLEKKWINILNYEVLDDKNVAKI